MATTLEKDEVDLICSGSYKGMDVRQNHEYGRLRRQHLLHKNVMNDKLIRVPLLTDTPITILDSGTGDGIWLLDAADEYPQATLVGTDLFEKHFDQLRDFLPPSISFKIQNLLDP